MYLNNIIFTLIISFLIGTLYYIIMIKDIPYDSNCSFLANIWTDLFAFLYGFILIYMGYNYKDYILIFLGGSIITEHVWQMTYKI